MAVGSPQGFLCRQWAPHTIEVRKNAQQQGFLIDLTAPGAAPPPRWERGRPVAHSRADPLPGQASPALLGSQGQSWSDPVVMPLLTHHQEEKTSPPGPHCLTPCLALPGCVATALPLGSRGGAGRLTSSPFGHSRRYGPPPGGGRLGSRPPSPGWPELGLWIVYNDIAAGLRTA